MGPVAAITTCFRKSFSFSGRAARSEFWWFYLSVMVAGFFATFFDASILGRPIGGFSLFSFATFLFAATFIPILAAGARRFHDVALPGLLFVAPVTTSYVIHYYQATHMGYLTEYKPFGIFDALFYATSLLPLAVCCLPSRPAADNWDASQPAKVAR